MDKHIVAQFDKINGMKTTEVIGNMLFDVELGSYCIFDKASPTNSSHYHNCYEICLVTGGIGEFLHGDCIYSLMEGDLFVANPGIAHEIRIKPSSNNSSESSLHLIFFRANLYYTSETTPLLYEEKLLKEFIDKHSILKSSQSHLFSYLDFINSYLKSSTTTGDYGLRQIPRNLALECLFSLTNTDDVQPPGTPSSSSIVDLAIQYISSNLHRRMYISEIAKSSCTSERNLQHVFKKHMSMSVTDYVNKRKTAIAAAYLKMNFPVRDISNLIGITDVTDFSRLFKKYYNVPPKKYQTLYSVKGTTSGANY